MEDLDEEAMAEEADYVDEDQQMEGASWNQCLCPCLGFTGFSRASSKALNASSNRLSCSLPNASGLAHRHQHQCRPQQHQHQLYDRALKNNYFWD